MQRGKTSVSLVFTGKASKFMFKQLLAREDLKMQVLNATYNHSFWFDR